MKKILSIALVALLAASTVFAGFSGNAKVAFGYDTTSKKYGFANSTGVTVDVDLATADAEKVAEGDVYAGIKASLAVKLGNYKASDKYAAAADYNGESIWNDNGYKMGIGSFIEIAEAYVAGEGWKVSILGAPDSANDFAKSAIDTKKTAVKDIFGNKYDTKNTAVSYKASYDDFAGVTATVKDFTVGLGLEGKAVKDAETFGTSVFVATPDFEVADGLKIKAGAEYYFDDNQSKAGVEKHAIGGSLKVAYENDAFSASAATDMGYDVKAEEFGADVAANFVISPVTVDVYYATKVETTAKVKLADTAKTTENLLSAKAAVDLKAFDVPVAFTFTGKDLVNKQDLSVKAAFNITEELSADASVGYVINTKKFSTSANVAYAADAFTAKAGVAYSKIFEKDDASVLSATASVESSAIIPGATLALTYGTDSDDNDMNFLKDQTNSSVKKQNLGAITASCKISF